ncbi:hypothetical protein C3F09_01885 [candidate division GN15 bacterium]|uniref:Dockerin domain-containing protein n=1 Tax=candidate division GN15 bacterium TaxID=2072418 RepID=A0A855XAX7_9BACT|nr:MAG: hypothetical protein C3F09_01885 [candidate division GN15 bacterium]
MRASVFVLLAIVFCSAAYGADVQPSPWKPMNGVSGWVHSLAVLDGRLYVGGDRNELLGPTSPATVAVWNGTTWIPLGGDIAERATALGVYKGDLIVGCQNFSGGGPVGFHNVLRWTGSNWEPLGDFPDPYTEVDGLTTIGDTLYVTSFNGNYRFDGITWTEIPHFPYDEAVNLRLAQYEGNVYMGTAAGAGTVPRVLRLTEFGWAPVFSSDGATTPVGATGVFSMLDAHGMLYAGGSMLLAEQPCAVAAFNGTDWIDMTFNLPARISGLGLYHDTLVVGTADGMWQLVGERWKRIGTTSDDVTFIGEYAGSLVAAGWFETVDGNAAPFVSQWFGCCAGLRGNVNFTGIVDLGDLSALVSFLTGGGYVLPCNEEADVNGMGIVDLSDLSSLVSYLTGGGYVLPNCP